MLFSCSRILSKIQCGLQFLLIPPVRLVDVHHRPLAMNLFLSGRLWHVQGGCSTPTLLPDMHPSRALLKCSPTPGSQGTLEHSHLLSLDFSGRIMLWGQKEQWCFSMGRGEKGHIESKFVIILIKEIICKDLNLYFLISLFLSPQLLTHLLHPLAACQFQFTILLSTKNVSWFLTSPALLISSLINRHYIQCHQCKGCHVSLAGPRSMDTSIKRDL